jgi:hypothetical protein
MHDVTISCVEQLDGGTTPLFLAAVQLVPADVAQPDCRWRRKRVPVWRSRGSQVWGYALASGGRRNREEADCFLSQARLSSVLARGVR